MATAIMEDTHANGFADPMILKDDIAGLAEKSTESHALDKDALLNGADKAQDASVPAPTEDVSFLFRLLPILPF